MANPAKVAVDITALQDNEKTIQQYISQMEALNARLETLLGRIESSWEGKSSQAYLNLMRGYAAQAVNMGAAMREFEKYVQKACTMFEAKDRAAASRILGSF